jgi:hypothetical protein
MTTKARDDRDRAAGRGTSEPDAGCGTQWNMEDCCGAMMRQMMMGSFTGGELCARDPQEDRGRGRRRESRPEEVRCRPAARRAK